MTRRPSSAAAKAQPDTDTGRTRALDRGLQILEVIAERSSATLVEIADACDLSPATASRILKTLEARGFVSRETDTRAYGIGLKAFEVGSRFLSETRLQETCRLILRKLSAATGQTTTLTVMHQSDVVYLDVQEGRSPLRSTLQIGSRAPAYATASGKCLLAFRWGDGLVESIGPGPYTALTEKTITNLEPLKQELVAVRQRGIASDNEELYPDISSMACPVHDRSGEVIAAIAIQALTSQMATNADTWAPLLRSAAAESSLRLGWRERAQEKFTSSTSLLID